ncbi:MAG: MarR family transcriptional regulator [Actinobacteria bacterium]|nr:MarR family transcriptional regulator [Actinomycetota bacterium]
MSRDQGSERRSKEGLIDEISLAIRTQHNQVYAYDDIAASRLGVNRTDLRVMDILTREEPLTAGELADRTRLTTGAVTAVLDRMEETGYVRRRHDPEDRRRVLVEVAPKAWERCAEIWGPLSLDAVELMASYSTSELETILDFFERGNKTQRHHLERVGKLRSRRRARGVTRAGRRRHASD